MSLGYIPVIISIILCEFIIQDIAIYIGAGVGVLSSIYMWQRKGPHIPQFILYSTTGMLLLLTITSFFSADYCPEAMFPFTLEISAIIPPLIIFLNRRRFLSYHTAQTHKCCKQFFAQGAEAAIVSARVLLLIGFLHFLIISLAILFGHPLNDTLRYILFRIMPPCVFILGILFNQFGIYYFNKIMSHTVFVPIVTKKGDVIGKAMASEAINRKNEYINPVIRITVTSHGMLFLLPRPERILQEILPSAPPQNLHFCFMYHFENEITNRLVYNFILDLNNDSILCNKKFKGGKLWTFQQIEHNLHRNFFSSCFEREYEHTKEIIYTREKYKEF